MTNPKTHAEHQKPVIYFVHAKRGFVLGKEFAESIAYALGEQEAEKWIGKSVEIYPVKTPLGVGVRARPAQNGATTPPAELEDEDEDENTG